MYLQINVIVHATLSCEPQFNYLITNIISIVLIVTLICIKLIIKIILVLTTLPKLVARELESVW
jgi:hypothetical protein